MVRGVYTVLAVLSLSGWACAYIDPGTGGMIVSGAGGAIWPLVAAGLAAAAGIFVRFFNPIKRGFAGLWKRVRAG